MVNSHPNWPIKIISLPDAVKRRVPLLASLKQLGLQYELVDAVDGRSGLDSRWEADIDRELAERRMGRPLTNTEWGCALSHVTVYRQMIEQGLSGAIVLEDDAEVGESFKLFLEGGHFAKHEFIQLDYGQAHTYRFGLGRSSLMQGIATERLVCNSSLTTGYSISSKAARFILDHALPLSLPADWPCDLAPLAPVIAVPRIVRHPPFDTGNSHMLDTREAKARARKTDRARRGIKQNPRPVWFNFGRRVLVKTLPREP